MTSEVQQSRPIHGLAITAVVASVAVISVWAGLRRLNDWMVAEELELQGLMVPLLGSLALSLLLFTVAVVVSIAAIRRSRSRVRTTTAVVVAAIIVVGSVFALSVIG